MEKGSNDADRPMAEVARNLKAQKRYHRSSLQKLVSFGLPVSIQVFFIKQAYDSGVVLTAPPITMLA